MMGFYLCDQGRKIVINRLLNSLFDNVHVSSTFYDSLNSLSKHIVKKVVCYTI